MVLFSIESKFCIIYISRTGQEKNNMVGTKNPENMWLLHSWRYLKAVWTLSWTTCSRWRSLLRGLEQMTSRGLFQTPSFCDSGILYSNICKETRIGNTDDRNSEHYWRVGDYVCVPFVWIFKTVWCVSN